MAGWRCHLSLQSSSRTSYPRPDPSSSRSLSIRKLNQKGQGRGRSKHQDIVHHDGLSSLSCGGYSYAYVAASYINIIILASLLSASLPLLPSKTSSAQPSRRQGEGDENNECKATHHRDSILHERHSHFFLMQYWYWVVHRCHHHH
jgi:hypothetical protein